MVRPGKPYPLIEHISMSPPPTPSWGMVSLQLQSNACPRQSQHVSMTNLITDHISGKLGEVINLVNLVIENSPITFDAHLW